MVFVSFAFVGDEWDRNFPDIKAFDNGRNTIWRRSIFIWLKIEVIPVKLCFSDNNVTLWILKFGVVVVDGLADKQVFDLFGVLTLE
jgi:hypothetical protein